MLRSRTIRGCIGCNITLEVFGCACVLALQCSFVVSPVLLKLFELLAVSRFNADEYGRWSSVGL